MIKAYFFDWGDTLVTMEDTINFGKHLTNKEHESLLITNDFSKVKLANGKRNLIYNALLEARFNLFPDSSTVIEKLKEEEYKLAIISNAYCITPERSRVCFPDFFKLFDIVTFSSEVGMRKPNKEIFTYTLNKLNKEYNVDVLPNQVMMIGDREDNDIMPALQLGMQAKLINRTKQTLYDII